VPDGDPAAIVDRALTLLLADLARKKGAVTRKPAKNKRQTADGSRHAPSDVMRAVWARDGGQCAHRAPSGRRCTARAFLEYHHLEPFAVGGATTVANIQLRCRAHNAYEAVVFYGPGHMEKARALSTRDSTRPGTSAAKHPRESARATACRNTG
jgi:hypothetical protein